MIASQSPPVDPDRESLIRGAVAGDRVSLEGLIREMWPTAYKIAWSVLRNTVAAEDAAQDACARVAANITELRSPQAFTIWFYRIAFRAALRYRAQPLDTIPENLAAPPVPIEERLDIAVQIMRLDQSLRVAVVLRYYLDCTSREIATILGIPAPTVRFRLAVARRRLRIALSTSLPGGTIS